MSRFIQKTSMMYYPWQRNQWQMLDGLIEMDRLPHAMMLCGPAYIGKQQFASVLAGRLLCEKPQAGFACGNCKQCLLLAAKTHPDLLWLLPEEEGKAIRIDPIRSLGQFVSKTALQRGRKVVVISPAESMNLNAANALLKNLEEPAPGTHVILVSHEPSRLPATVRSRCRTITFPVPPLSEVENWLTQVSGKKENLSELMDYAGGRPLLALQLLESDLLENRRAFERLLDDVAVGAMNPIAAAEKCLSSPSVMTVDWLYSRVATQVRNTGAMGASPLQFRFLDKLVQVKSRLLSSANPNVSLLWEELMMDWQRLTR
ncbi:DNA polymerase III subunit delta' [Porticoccus sp.]